MFSIMKLQSCKFMKVCVAVEMYRCLNLFCYWILHLLFSKHTVLYEDEDRRKLRSCRNELETLVTDDKKWPSKVKRMRLRATIDVLNEDMKL